MKDMYVQYGCGLSAPLSWKNFDASPTLRIQKSPLSGFISKKKLNTSFPANVLFGDIVKGLPINVESCDGLYCSHVLEHLSLNDFRTALINSFKILKPGGVFRCVVPDLEAMARSYIKRLDSGDSLASVSFVKNTLLGVEQRERGLKGLLSSFLGNSHHLWMWDTSSLSEELKRVGFIQIRTCQFNDCEDEMFKQVEDANRFENAVAIECRR